MVYYGQGFTHSDVYNMPIYLRNFYFQKLIKVRKEENEQIKKSQQKNKSISKPFRNPRFKR